VKTRVWTVAAGAGAVLATLCAGLPYEVPLALAVAVPPTLVVALWLAVRGDADERGALVPIFLAAVAVRIVVALAVAYAAPDGYFALDDQRYAALGQELARHWAGESGFPVDLHGAIGYYAWNALLYTLVGPVPLAVTLLNGVLGGVASILAWRIARDLGGVEAARLAALLTAFFPSLVLWSSLNLKDPWALVAILLCLRGAQRLAAGPSLVALAAIGIGIAGLGELRGYLAVVAAAAIGVGLALPRLRGPRASFAMVALLALGAIAVVSLGPIEGLGEEASLESLDRARRELAIGASAYQADADVSTPASALRFLPLGLTYFLLAPAPWQVWNTRQLLTLPEMLAWYALIPQIVAGLAYTLRRRFASALPLATFALFATVSYALVESNLGTAYRHRAQVVVLFLVFGAVGLARRGERSRAAARSTATERTHPQPVQGRLLA
jgi:hypothetical protein